MLDDAEPGSREKAPEAFRTISEVAAELDVPQHVLRFWEQRFSHIKPIKRGGNRRYYRPQDVDLLRGIRALLYADGFTIKGVQKLLREQGVRYVAALGRNESSLISQLSQKSGVSLTEAEGGEAPMHARAALAAVAAAHPDAVVAPAEMKPAELDGVVRGRLAEILTELEGLRERLHSLPWRLAAE
jgi:DNA-binding transcriptional MerR regulator